VSGVSRSFNSIETPLSARAELGKRLRVSLPRSEHAIYRPSATRLDPIALLRRSNRGRATHLVSIRYGRMARSPFAFLRGSAIIMAHDLASTPTTALTVQLCGDAHIGNFGGYATAERSLVFDLNDFDETLAGPWEWDLKRLSASVTVLGRENGLKAAACRAAVCAAVQAYRKRMRELSEKPYLDIWFTPTRAEAAVDAYGDDAGLFEHALENGMNRTNRATLPKFTDGRYGRSGFKFKDDPPNITRRADRLRRELHDVLEAYRRSLTVDRRLFFDRYRITDVARKVVGVGSVGLGSYAVLLQGAGSDDPLFLQLKEAPPSVLEEHLTRSPFSHNGQRVVAGQRIMQAASDPLLGWTRLGGRDFYVRQLRDMKATIPVEQFDADELAKYAALCAGVLARAHACSGDAAQIAGYLGRGEHFDGALSKFAESYADQVEDDHQALLTAIEKGRVRATFEDD
jgi:uncharacterized protein (DUF2252 family)